MARRNSGYDKHAVQVVALFSSTGFLAGVWNAKKRPVEVTGYAAT